MSWVSVNLIGKIYYFQIRDLTLNYLYIKKNKKNNNKKEEEKTLTNFLT